jgi:hypothetical protein
LEDVWSLPEAQPVLTSFSQPWNVPTEVPSPASPEHTTVAEKILI